MSKVREEVFQWIPPLVKEHAMELCLTKTNSRKLLLLPMLFLHQGPLLLQLPNLLQPC